MTEVWSAVADWLAARAGDTAWKLKRPVRFAFLDFSTLEKRKWALDRELSFNRRWSGDIYRAVRPVTRQGETFAIGGEGHAVEWLLEMRRFDPDAVIGHRPEPMDPALADDLGRLIARAHIDAPIASRDVDLGAYGYTVDSNEMPLKETAAERALAQRVIDGTRAGRDALTPLLMTRLDEGFARQCHGDLHLGNILLEAGRPVPFDCLEFNDTLSWMDALYDVAFPIMDLVVRGQTIAANRLLNAYLDEAARGFPPSLWRGLRVLPQFLAVRASVRAHVTGSNGERETSARYLRAAEEFLTAPTPRLIAVGGLSGTGKTHFARHLAPLIAPAPGAVILRSDEVRKRLWNVGSLDPLPPEAYAPTEDGRVYGEIFAAAALVLAAGCPVVLDATFLDPARRVEAEAIAARAGVPFDGLWLKGEPSELRARLAARAGDASDADLAVLERQLARDAVPVTWRSHDIQSGLDRLARDLARPGGQ